MATSSKPAAAVDPAAVLGHKFLEVSFSYDERDVALYALGDGACGEDAVDDKELHLVYHRDGQPHIKCSPVATIEHRWMKLSPARSRKKIVTFQIGMNENHEVLPTFVSLFPYKENNRVGILDVPGLNFDPSLLLHGQQYIEIYRRLPSYANGKQLFWRSKLPTSLQDSGEILCMNRSTIYLRGAGGFSDPSCPYSYADYPANQVSRISIPNTTPSAVYEDQTKQSQALLYRLNGDYNPLHSDPMIAQVAGFGRPTVSVPLDSLLALSSNLSAMGSQQQ